MSLIIVGQKASIIEFKTRRICSFFALLIIKQRYTCILLPVLNKWYILSFFFFYLKVIIQEKCLVRAYNMLWVDRKICMSDADGNFVSHCFTICICIIFCHPIKEAKWWMDGFLVIFEVCRTRLRLTNFQGTL